MGIKGLWVIEILLLIIALNTCSMCSGLEMISKQGMLKKERVQ